MDVKTVATDNAQEPSGFPGYVFSGDRDLCISLIPSAKNLLHQVRLFIANSGTSVYGLTREVQGGLIRVTSNAGIEKIEISANTSKEKEPFSADGVEILSGVVKGGKIVTITPPIMGEPEFESTRSYRPTAQAYKYPLKKRPGNYPKTVILPGNTFEDQPRLAVVDKNLLARSLGPPRVTFIGDEAVAFTKIATAQALLDAETALLTAVDFYRNKVVSFPWGYVAFSCTYGVPTASHICIYAEMSGNYMHERTYNVAPDEVKNKLNTTGTHVNGTTPIKLMYGPFISGDLDVNAHAGSISSSMYSGMMSKAVQIIQGYGKLKTKKHDILRETAGVMLQYDWRWARCHGITTASDGALWLVEISISNGVIAMPLPVFQNTTKGTPLYSYCKNSDQSALSTAVSLFGGLPSGACFPPVTVDSRILSASPGTKNLAQSIAAGDVIVLATPAEMSPYFECFSYSPWLGWSFNDNGHEAHNTAGDYDGYSIHFKLDITIQGKRLNREPNTPLALGSATLSQVSREKLVYHGKFTFFNGDTVPAKFSPATQVKNHAALASAIQTTLFVAFINNTLERVFYEAGPPMADYELVTADADTYTSGVAIRGVYLNGRLRATKGDNAVAPEFSEYINTTYIYGPPPDYNQVTSVDYYLYPYSLPVFTSLSHLQSIGVNFSTLNGAGAWPRGARDCFAFPKIRKFHSENGDTPSYVYAVDGEEGAIIVMKDGVEIDTSLRLLTPVDLRVSVPSASVNVPSPFNLMVSHCAFSPSANYHIAVPPGIEATAINANAEAQTIVDPNLMASQASEPLNNYSFIGYI